jgi:hypothetical protein
MTERTTRTRRQRNAGALGVVAVLAAAAVAEAQPAASSPSVASVAGALTLPAASTPATPHYRAPFTIEIDGITTSLSLVSTTLLPGERLTVRTSADSAHAATGSLRREGERWHWLAPDDPTVSTITFERDGHRIVLQAFVLTPWENGRAESLNGYRIGAYSSKPLKGLSTYVAPRGFIEVNQDLAALRVSPHFSLGQFLCKQQSGSNPSYMLVRAALLVKLERLREEVDAHFPTPTLAVMSGFRTPWYNAAIGNRTVYSRHLYGGAADVFVDRDGDGRMDDLNADGRIDKSDAAWLADVAERLAESGDPQWPSGGVGVYDANAVHGPFIHVDARGFRARWGRTAAR